MSTTATATEIRQGLQGLMSREHDLVNRAANATAGGQYRRLRDLADELVEVAERRIELRTALAEARTRDEAEKRQPSAQQRLPDGAAAT